MLLKGRITSYNAGPFEWRGWHIWSVKVAPCLPSKNRGEAKTLVVFRQSSPCDLLIYGQSLPAPLASSQATTILPRFGALDRSVLLLGSAVFITNVHISVYLCYMRTV
jgi:hypothetical protein